MFSGSIVALVTPMHADGSVDKKRLGELLEWHISEGTDGVVIAGSTGEGITLEPEETDLLLRFTLDCVNNRIPVIAGTGSSSTARTIKTTQNAFSLGVDACLIVTPYYNKPTQEGLYQHYRLVAESVSGPIIPYNVPGRTGCDLLPQTVARLLPVTNIVALKESVGTRERFSTLVNQCGNQIDILSGEDSATLDLLELGGKGVISVVANVAPAKMAALCRAGREKDWARAKQLSQQLAGLSELLFVESNPIPVKWALAQMGKIESSIRLPLVPLSESCHDKVRAAMQQAEIL